MMTFFCLCEKLDVKLMLTMNTSNDQYEFTDKRFCNMEFLIKYKLSNSYKNPN